MNPKFYVSNRDLMVEMDGEIDTLIAPRFMQRDNADKAGDFLRIIASNLNVVYASNPDAAASILETAENKVYDAQTSEKFLEPVIF